MNSVQRLRLFQGKPTQPMISKKKQKIEIIDLTGEDPNDPIECTPFTPQEKPKDFMPDFSLLENELSPRGPPPFPFTPKEEAAIRGILLLKSPQTPEEEKRYIDLWREELEASGEIVFNTPPKKRNEKVPPEVEETVRRLFEDDDFFYGKNY